MPGTTCHSHMLHSTPAQLPLKHVCILRIWLRMGEVGAHILEEPPEGGVDAQPGRQYHADLGPCKDPGDGTQRLYAASLHTINPIAS